MPKNDFQPAPAAWSRAAQLQGEAARRLVKLDVRRAEDGADLEIELEAGMAVKMLSEHGRALETIRRQLGGAK